MACSKLNLTTHIHYIFLSVRISFSTVLGNNSLLWWVLAYTLPSRVVSFVLRRVGSGGHWMLMVGSSKGWKEVRWRWAEFRTWFWQLRVVFSVGREQFQPQVRGREAGTEVRMPP